MAAWCALLPAIVLLVLDFLWISLNHQRYGGLVSGVRCGRPMTVSTGMAVLAYAFVVAAVYVLVVPGAIKADTWTAAVGAGAIVGLIVYGIFNATNASMFWPSYDVRVAVVDTLWGTTLFGIVGAVAWLCHRRSRLSSRARK